MITFSSLVSTGICTNAFGISKVMPSIFFFVSITAVVIKASVVTVGLMASCLSIYDHCVLPLAQALAFIVPFLFSVRNIRLLIALFLSVCVSSDKWIG